MPESYTLNQHASEPGILRVAKQGPAGVNGADGTGDLTYVHTQVAPAATWIVAHGLGKRPSVTVVDSAGSVVVGEAVYDSDNQVTLTFAAGFAGKAYFN